MAGNKEGALKASLKNRTRYGQDFYKKIGAMGGAAGHTGGFYANPDLASEAGKLGGRISKKGKRFIGFDEQGEPKYVPSE